ncbi:UDP-N-acetylmuramoylalanine--D-glutamate ligase [candidate division WOR-1 bacterium RIFCSPHIGHO2_01_FULL_53_15]|uniref:UDP-N-acetylmuramoylalanine--D-glutamate ligase n=1 Tax=candidate division WOR-1 bacterium RIFCSPHIGHO2_01_FULL_53_15 TaxID=1802564 RepID=A0A1F4PZQ4_UNCSA|nr:MAG: UDP-N-acetylmuramoylalanine--D-glutamate ligase [candidate division WOR-1 bacterium RIFCSPHIGHO2_01_FULL_53_15]OGC10806.1 MAG: UDP-N-acetylmuramoylalanine--D-glutamate ligase [candidate division WOR-1 bacterium RIFCSPHIGHO2_02_FULL_53_26]
MDLKNKKVTIFGLGKSGVASARKLVALGAAVKATDANPTLDIGTIEGLGIEVELGGHSAGFIQGDDLIVVSPGIHLDHPALVEARGKNIPIISEIELASRFITKPIIAVTGTNGKTTTTTLIGEMLRAGGKRIAVAGNIGLPLVDVDDSSLDFVVAEISSYQLESIADFKPWLSVALNIQPDHLERHHTLEGYIKQKARLFMNQTGDDYLVYNQDDPAVVEMVKAARSKLVPFSKAHPEIITLPPEMIKIPGRHNLENALAAAQTAYLCGVKKDVVAEVLRTFPGVEHRIEYVTSISGIEAYNDSKGTNPDSTMVAIETFKGRGIVLILGGRDKGVGLEALAQKVKENVKAVVLIGEAAARFESALKSAGFNEIYQAGFSLDAAVRQAFVLAEPRDVVLLSPACASFDMFHDYEARGRTFKEIVKRIKL